MAINRIPFEQAQQAVAAYTDQRFHDPRCPLASAFARLPHVRAFCTCPAGGLSLIEVRKLAASLARDNNAQIQ